MGFGKSSFSGAINRAKDLAGLSKQSSENKQKAGTPPVSNRPAKSGDYDPQNKNWFKALPYGFKRIDRDGIARTMFLPINPSNIQITTHYATNIIPTLYGTVEEHSEVRYFDIVISGTTGISPRYPDEFAGNKKNNIEEVKKDQYRRQSFPVHSPVLGGFFGRTIGTVNSVINKTTDTIEGVKSLFGKNKTTASTDTGVFIDSSGYAAFHNLYRFFLKYKRDAAGLDSEKQRKGHPLQFLNYKDNTRYDVAVQNFVMKKDVDDPMLYKYTITLRAYNLRSLFGSDVNFDDLKERLATLGLDSENMESTSTFNKMKTVSGGVKGVVGAAKGILGLF